MRPVTVSQISDGQALIDSGLKPNETVVIEGQYRLEPGSLSRSCTARRPRAPTCKAPSSRQSREPLRPIHPPADRNGVAHGGLAAVRACCLPADAGLLAAQRQLPDHRSVGAVAGRRSGDHGVLGGDSARAAIHPNPRGHPAHLRRARSASPSSPSSSTLAAMSTARPRMSSPRSTRRARTCPSASPTRRPSAR